MKTKVLWANSREKSQCSVHALPSKATARLYQSDNSVGQFCQQTHLMEEQKSAFNLKLSTCLHFRWKDLPSITKIIILLPSFRNLALASLHGEWWEADSSPRYSPSSPCWLFRLLWHFSLMPQVGWKWGYAIEHTKGMLDNSNRPGDHLTLGNQTSYQLDTDGRSVCVRTKSREALKSWKSLSASLSKEKEQFVPFQDMHLTFSSHLGEINPTLS